jgi:hypothetical protein
VIETVETTGNILSDKFVVLNNEMVVRKVSACVEVDGKWREMKFITNNREWSAKTICYEFLVS